MSESDDLLNELKKQTAAIEQLNKTMMSFASMLSFNMGAILGELGKFDDQCPEDEGDGLTPSKQYLDGSNVQT